MELIQLGNLKNYYHVEQRALIKTGVLTFALSVISFLAIRKCQACTKWHITPFKGHIPANIFFVTFSVSYLAFSFFRFRPISIDLKGDFETKQDALIHTGALTITLSVISFLAIQNLQTDTKWHIAPFKGHLPANVTFTALVVGCFAFSLSHFRPISKLTKEMIAHRLIAEGKEIAVSIENAKYKAEALKSIAVAQAKAGDVEGAQETFREAKEAVNLIEHSLGKFEVLSEIVIAQAQTGDADGAKATLQGAKESANSMRNRENKDFVLRSIIFAQARLGDFAGAKETIEDCGFKTGSLSFVAQTQAQVGEIEEAQKTANTVKQVGCKAKAFCAIARAQAKAGNVEKAKRNTDLFKEAWWKAEILCAIARGQVEVDDLEGAKKTLQEAKVIVNPIDDAWCKIQVLLLMARAQAKAVDIEGGRESLREATEIANTIESADNKDLAFKIIAEARAKVGDFAGAKEILGHVRKIPWKADALCSVAIAQVKAGDLEGARVTVASVDFSLRLSKVRSCVVQAQAKSDWPGAREIALLIEDRKERAIAFAKIAEVILRRDG